MQKPVGNPFDPPARHLKPAIQFLRKLGVPAARIGALLGETADNIRHIDSRSYAETPESSPLLAFNELSANRLTVRNKDQRGSYEESRRRLEALEEEIERLRQEHGRADLVSGQKKLKELLPHVSSASRPHALRIRAKLEENIAWFSTHLGLARTAYFYAKEAMDHRRECYRQSSALNKEHLTAYADAALTASNSLMISYRPLEAIAVLDSASQAQFTAGKKLGSEWYRQLATALLQMGAYDRLAYRLYDKAGREMELPSGYSHPVAIQMNRDRQQNLLNPHTGWERAQTLVAAASRAFGEFSLEHVMATNWAAAVGFQLDSNTVHEQAQESLQTLMRLNLPFEHQGTITKLLSITPELELKGDILDRWIRFALYQNAARSK